jgi:hypothetical protein
VPFIRNQKLYCFIRFFRETVIQCERNAARVLGISGGKRTEPVQTGVEPRGHWLVLFIITLSFDNGSPVSAALLGGSEQVCIYDIFDIRFDRKMNRFERDRLSESYLKRPTGLGNATTRCTVQAAVDTTQIRSKSNQSIRTYDAELFIDRSFIDQLLRNQKVGCLKTIKTVSGTRTN